MRFSGMRFASSASSRTRIGAVSIDRHSCASTAAGEPLPLGAKVVATLIALHDHAGEVVSKAALIERVWGESPVDESSLWQNVHVLRGMLVKHAPCARIETVKGRGYRLIVEEPVADKKAYRIPAWLWSIGGAAAASFVFAFIHAGAPPKSALPHRVLFLVRSDGPMPALPPLPGGRVILQ